MVEFGKRLRAIRKEKHLTQLALAQRIGITKAMVSAYETGIRYPSYDILVRLATNLGVSIDYLFGLKSKRVLPVDGLTDAQVEILSNLMDEFRAANRRGSG